MNNAPLDGFTIGFHSSLAEPITIAGVPRMVAIMNATLAAIISFGLQVPWIGIPASISIHSISYWVCIRDPYAFDALRRHLMHQSYLDA